VWKKMKRELEKERGHQDKNAAKKKVKAVSTPSFVALQGCLHNLYFDFDLDFDLDFVLVVVLLLLLFLLLLLLLLLLLFVVVVVFGYHFD